MESTGRFHPKTIIWLSCSVNRFVRHRPSRDGTVYHSLYCLETPDESDSIGEVLYVQTREVRVCNTLPSLINTAIPLYSWILGLYVTCYCSV